MKNRDDLKQHLQPVKNRSKVFTIVLDSITKEHMDALIFDVIIDREMSK